MSEEKVTLEKTLGGLGRVIAKGQELKEEERRPVVPPPTPPTEEPTPTKEPGPTSPAG